MMSRSIIGLPVFGFSESLLDAKLQFFSHHLTI